MKLVVPLEVDVNLTEEEIIKYLKGWTYPLLKNYQLDGSDYWNSIAIVKNGKLYWQFCTKDYTEVQFREIKIDDENVYNFCKSAVSTICNYNILKGSWQRIDDIIITN